MRKQKEIKLDEERSITIKEMRLKDVLRFGNSILEMAENFNVIGLKAEFQRVVEATTDKNIDFFLELSFSELEEFEKVFMEINSPFLARLDQFKIKQIVEQIVKDKIQEALASLDLPEKKQEEPKKALEVEQKQIQEQANLIN